MRSFDRKPREVIQNKRSQDQSCVHDPYASITQLSSLLGNQAMLAMLRSENHEGMGGEPFFEQMRAKFEQTKKPKSREQESANQRSCGASLPDYLREKFKKKSGLPMDDVRVHYDSEKPAQIDALAYTRGTDVYVGPGQEKHLEHELGHVVQQKYGVVQATAQKNGLSINDSNCLEYCAEHGILTPPNQHNNHCEDVIQRKPRKIAEKEGFALWKDGETKRSETENRETLELRYEDKWGCGHCHDFSFAALQALHDLKDEIEGKGFELAPIIERILEEKRKVECKDNRTESLPKPDTTPVAYMNVLKQCRHEQGNDAISEAKRVVCREATNTNSNNNKTDEYGFNMMNIGSDSGINTPSLLLFVPGPESRPEQKSNTPPDFSKKFLNHSMILNPGNVVGANNLYSMGEDRGPEVPFSLEEFKARFECENGTRFKYAASNDTCAVFAIPLFRDAQDAPVRGEEKCCILN